MTFEGLVKEKKMCSHFEKIEMASKVSRKIPEVAERILS